MKKELEKVHKISSLVEKQLANYKEKDQKKIQKLSIDELQDLQEILKITDLILTKHETNRDFHLMLKEFVGIINNSAYSIETLDDEICELVLSAEGTIGKIKNLQGKVSKDYDFEHKKTENSPQIAPKTSANNLTNSSTRVYTHEYQHNSTVEAEQVI